MFANEETAAYVLEKFLNINDQMDETIVQLQSRLPAAELKALKRGVGYVMCEVFEKIVEPICAKYPSLKPPGME